MAALTNNNNRRRNNSWKLCKSHCNCNKCSYTLTCYKKKADKHSANAQALKFVLMCLLRDETETYTEDEETGEIPKIEVVERNGEKMKFLKCGICFESITKGGEHNLCALSCGHTICLKCANNDVWRRELKCPYCKVKTTKIIKLYYEDDTEE